MLTIVNKSNEVISIRAKGIMPNNTVYSRDIGNMCQLRVTTSADPIVKVALFSTKGALCLQWRNTEDTLVEVYTDKPVYIQKQLGIEFFAILKDFAPVVLASQLNDSSFSFDMVYNLVEPYNQTIRIVHPHS